MRKTIAILLTITCMTFYAFGQDNNEKLYKGIAKGDTSIVKQLLNDKADPNYIKAEGSWMKVNMLITAVNNGNIDIVKMLIANKADVKWKDEFKTTALIYAASNGNKEIVVLLLDNGADINDNDGQGNTVLSAAKESKNKELITFIEEKLKEKK
jgi:ankyrin repeat protein